MSAPSSPPGPFTTADDIDAALAFLVHPEASVSDDRISAQQDALDRLLSLQEPEESDAAFARRLGIAPQVLSNYKNGHHGLSLKSALTVHESAGISLDWLLAGHGSPWLPEDGEGGGERAFEDGSRYVYDRLVRAVTELTRAMERAGTLDREDAEAIQSSLTRYLDGTSTVESEA